MTTNLSTQGSDLLPTSTVSDLLPSHSSLSLSSQNPSPAPTPAPSSHLKPRPPSDPDIHAHVTELWTALRPKSPIYSFLLTDLHFTHVSQGLIIARLPLSKAHINSHGGLHGSVTATIVDWAGGMAIASWDSRSKTGVSVDINVSYVGVARDGDEIEIEAEADKVGGSLGFTSIRISKVVDGRAGPLIATGSHTKFVRQRE